MIKANFSTYGTYVTDSLHQWDINQVLNVTGLNLTVVPEVHFSNSHTDRAIVRQATMTNRVVSVEVPNSLLQEPLRIFAHIGVYEGRTFKVVEMVEIPVIARKRPADYQIQDSDEELYSFKKLENAMSNMATKAEARVISARVDAIIANGNNTEGNSELVDIRVGVDGQTYTSAGAAVRDQMSVAYALRSEVPMEYIVGSITAGIEEPTTIRARFAHRVKANKAVVTVAKNDTYYFGYAVYDQNGVFDGADHGWNPMADNLLTFDSGYFSFNFRRIDNREIIETDLEALASLITIKQINIFEDLAEVERLAVAGVPTTASYSLEVGTLSEGVPGNHANRCRFVDSVVISEKTRVSMLRLEDYLYGYSVYDQNGVFDGVDHGWNLMSTSPSVAFYDKGYARFNFRRVDDGMITEQDLSILAGALTIETSVNAVDVLSLVENEKDMKDAQASINVEYGRLNGASFVFVRLPKTTNAGKQLRPAVALTSADGSLGGAKTSALTYARNKGTAFTLNAGLFNTETLQPVGQTIIAGVSYVDTPMTDDMGTPISDAECYPLCINANGDLSAPYSRGVSTSKMLTDGVVYAVTGWGKIVENFAACADTVENEIVHAGKYIRQVLGQFQNGDYCVCTVDMSRGNVENEAGITYTELAQLLIDRGVKFAYSLDGGGSAETIIGKRQLNPIYEGETGRNVPTVITFNIEQ